jgi:hypothetical protein
MKFCLIGDGYIAKYHRKAIEHVGGEISEVIDPKYESKGYPTTPTDYYVICSPTNLHRYHIQSTLDFSTALGTYSQVIVEKPMCLPWEPLIDDDRINVVLQWRFCPDIPQHADEVFVRMVRDDAYFETWKGDPKLTGGIFYNLYIHYIDLAIRLGADFRGETVSDGVQVRRVDDFNLFTVDMQDCYNRMYEAILGGKGVKPRELYYLHWLMSMQSEKHGYGKNGKQVVIPRRLK